MKFIGLSSLPVVQAATEWNNAGVSLLSRASDNDDHSLLDSATRALQQGLNGWQETLRRMSAQPSPGSLSTEPHLKVSMESLSICNEQALSRGQCFIFSKTFKILNVETAPHLEVAAACTIFNVALTKHIAGLRRQDAALLSAAEQLYRLGLTVSEHQQDPTSLLLTAVALNNRGALLKLVGQDEAAKQCYGKLLPFLPSLERVVDTKLIGAAFEAIADSAISIVYEIDMNNKAAPAA